MNLPFTPNYLWPVPVLILTAGIVFDRYRKLRWRRRVEAKPSQEATTASRLPLRGRNVGLVVGGMLAFVAVLDLGFFAAPPVRGTLVETAGGAAIPGALVKRRLYRVGSWRIGDGPSAQTVRGSRVETHTAADGSFTLPGWVSLWPWGLQGLCGMAWMAYEPAHMPAYGCVRAPFRAWGGAWLGCGGFNAPMFPDPWVESEWKPGVSTSELHVKTALKREPEAWAEAFGRASRLLDEDWIELKGYVAEAVGYAATHEINEETAESFYLTAADLGGYYLDRDERKGVTEGGALIRIVVAYCASHPESEVCARNRVDIDHQMRKFRELGGSV